MIQRRFSHSFMIKIYRFRNGRALAKFQWAELRLNWLSSIDVSIARELARFWWRHLFLWWIKEIDADIARELAWFQWHELWLGWLDSIDVPSAMALSKFYTCSDKSSVQSMIDKYRRH